MNYKEIFENLRDYFSDDIKYSGVFNSLWDQISSYMKEDEFVLFFKANPLFLKDFIRNYGIEEATDSKELIFRFLGKDQSVVISIFFKKIENKVYHLYVNLAFPNSKSKIIEWHSDGLNSRVDIFYQTEVNGKITAYENHVQFYRNDVLLLGDFRKYEEILFANEFNIPLELAEFYREHFQEYVDYLNECRVKDMYNVMETYDPNSAYTFLPSFQMRDLKEFLCTQNQLELESEESLEINIQKLQSISEKLKLVVGDDSQVVISKSLYDAMIYHITNYWYDIEFINGYLMRKNDTNYTLFRVNITKENPLFVSFELTQEDALKWFRKGTYQEIDESLLNFFGISRGRK